MKNLIIAYYLLFASSLLIAQPAIDKTAKTILNEVSNKTKSYKSIGIDFSYSSEGSKDKKNEIMQGKIILNGAKYKLEIPKQHIFCDGKMVWTYLKDANEVQINNVDNSEESITPTSILNIWEKGYKYKFIKEEIQAGTTVEIIDLTPLKGKNYYKVRLTIDKLKKQVMRLSVYNKDGGTNTYKIIKFVPNAPVNDAMFVFNKASYPKVEVVDMR